MERYVVALDQGTTSSRAILFNRSGDILAKAQYPFRQIYPQPGWVEHDPMDLWNMEKQALAEVVDTAHIDPKRVAAIGITNQRETTILWDRATGVPVYNAIVWQCRRTADICESLVCGGHAPYIKRTTGLPVDAYFSGTKIKWMLDNISGAREAARQGKLLCGTVDTWLVWRLTGRHLTDVTNASRTMLFDINKKCWDPKLCELLDVPMSILPRVVDNCGNFGRVERRRGVPECPTFVPRARKSASLRYRPGRVRLCRRPENI
jgi:glycerol kinase